MVQASERETTPRECPICGLVNPDTAGTCDCGYNFAHPLSARRPRLSPAARRLLTGCFMPLALAAGCVALPPLAFFALTKSGIGDPNQYNETVNVGMTAEEVRAVLGSPNEVYSYTGGEVRWIYYCDRLGWSYLGIVFGPDGRVRGKWT
jgi:hypothetical protein